MKRSRFAVVIGAFTLLAAACSSSDESKVGTSTTPPASDVDATTQQGAATTAPVDSAEPGAATTAPVASPPTSTAGLGSLGLAITTPAGAGEVDSITWALYRDVQSLDPITAFDYPENTVLAILCEQPLRQTPEGGLVPGLTDVAQPDDVTYVLTVRDGATFWNGDPVTAEDIAFSLGRNLDPALPGFYGISYARVASITPTDDKTITIAMKEPDTWFRGVLASTSAWVVQKKFAEAAGADFGNPTGRTMCSGSFQLGDWKVGSPLVAERNDGYWDPSVKPMVKSIEFVAAPDPIALAAAIQSGDINGYFAFASLPTLQELKADPNVTVTDGAGYQFDAMLLAPREGSPLKDPKVRQALSLAIDRQGYVDTVLAGGGQIAKSFAAPGTWGYATDVYKAAYDALPDTAQDLDAAKALIADAGVEGKSFTIGLIGEIPPLVAEGAMFQKAAEDLGMKVEIKSYPADQYISLFIDPAARADVDAWFTVAYGDFAEPGALLGVAALPGGNSNYMPYDNAAVTDLLNKSRAAKDDAERAKLIVEAQAIIMDELPMIPVALPNNTMVTSANLTGAVPSFAMMFSPWANDLGNK